MLATKVNRVPSIKVAPVHWWDRNAFGLEVRKCCGQPIKIVIFGENDDITIAAKLGRAVKHARLAAHKQVLYLAGGKRRKDFVDRVRDQACHLSANRIARVSLIRASAVAESSCTTLARSLRHHLVQAFVSSLQL